MKKYLLLLFLINVTFLFSQNGIIGDGFGVSDWNTTDCFNSSAGSSRIFITNSNGTGNKYFRLVTCWDGNYTNWGPQNTDDKLLSYGTAYNSSDMIENSSKAYYLVADSSYNYVFKTREGGNPPGNLGVVIFEVQGEIRTVSSVSNNTTHSAGDPYIVTATLSGSLSSGQGVYLRYSDDSWNTSSVVEMTGSTTNYSASIPVDVNVAQASISYYIFTSGSGLTISAGDSDFFTINSNTNSGNNYSYDVVDTTAPVITLIGDPTVTLEVGSTYTEQGATATDNYDTSVSVVIGGDTVDTNTVGAYTVTYDATDANNNAATQVTRTVNVVDTTAPVITLTGDPTVTLEVGSTYTEQGATATDNYDTSVSVVIGGDTVDTNTVGAYTVTYDATDANNNAATQVTRTVNVVDTTAPVITLTGGSWTNNGTSVDFIDLSSFGQNGVFALATSPQAIQSDSNTTYAGGGSAPPDFVPSGSNGNAYGFCLLPTTSDPASTNPNNFNIGSNYGSTGNVTFNFTGVTNLDFIAYTGGELQEYSYDATASTLSITLSAVTAAGSENNPVGGQKLLGMVIITGANTGFGGAVFRTDMYWGDVKMQLSDSSYGNTSDFPGSNFSGNDGDMINFDYYINQTVLEALNQHPVTDIDQCTFRFTKADGTTVYPDITIEYYTTDGSGTAWNNNESPNGTSTFDFDGDGTVDNYVNASVQNDSWSSANGYMNGDQSLGVDTNLLDEIVIYGLKGSVFVSSGNVTIRRVDVYQLDGKKLISTKKSFIELNRGIYIVSVLTNIGKKNVKVLIN